MPSFFLLLIFTSVVFLGPSDVEGGLEPISFVLSTSTVPKLCAKNCKEISIKHASSVRFETAVRPQMFFGFLKFMGRALDVVGGILGIVKETTSDDNTAAAFNEVFQLLDRNLQSVSNVQESIDLLMTKSLDAIGNLDHDLEQSTARILADIDDVSRKVDRNYGYLLKVFKTVSATYTSVEKTRLEMHSEFKTLFEFMKNSKIQSTLTKMNNFVTYFADEKARISQLTRQERVATLLETDGFLQNLRQSRTPRGDSLESFLFEVTSQGYAIPQNMNDSVAFAALNGMYYGVQTQISVLWYLMKVEIYLADDFYRAGDIERFNEHMEHIVTDFQGFSSYLVGATGSSGLIDQAIDIIVKVSNLKFMDNSAGLMVKLLNRVESLKKAKIQMQQATLPLITDTPEKLATKIKFDGRSLKTPIGGWEDGATVRYALQYQQGDLYSRVGEWSEPFHIKGKANPWFRIPAHSLYSRIIFRKFNDETPQFIGILERGSGNDFWDINRDLYNAASGSDEEIAMREARILINSGANVSARFDLGRCAMHAAAMNGNKNLTNLFLNEATINSLDSNNYTPLHLAAENGWVDLVYFLTQSGSPVNAKAKCGSTPLHLAAANGYPSAVQALVRTVGIDVNAQDEDGSCPLHKAVLNGVDEVVKILSTDKRKDLNLQSKGKFTPLHLSAMVNNPGTTKLLLTSPSIATNARTDGNLTALHLAALTGNVPALRALIGNGCTNVNGRSVNGWTALHYAVSMLKPAVVTELLNNTDVIVDGLGAGQITPLHIAAATDQGQVVVELLQHGAAIDLPTDEGLTPLHLAATNNNTDTMKELLDRGANFNARTRDDSTIMHLVAARSSLLTAKFVLEHESRIQIRNNKTETPKDIALQMDRADIAELITTIADKTDQCRIAAIRGSLNTVRALIEQGACMLEAEDNPYGRTVLIYAVIHGHMDIVKFVLERGAYINHKDSYGTSPLSHAISNKRNMTKYLIGMGANANSFNNVSMTPLHLAAIYGPLEDVILLVDNGANVKARDGSHQTPLSLAIKNSQTSIVKYLVNKGGSL